MTRYLISFDDGAMTFPEEDLPDVAEAAHAVVQEAKDAGVWVFGGGLHSHEEVSVVATDGTVTDGPYPEQGVHRRILGCRRSLTRGGAGVGWQDRRRLPLCAGGSRVRARLYALIKAIRERRRKAFRVSPFAHHRLRQCSGMTPGRRLPSVTKGRTIERSAGCARCYRESRASAARWFRGPRSGSRRPSSGGELSAHLPRA